MKIVTTPEQDALIQQMLGKINQQHAYHDCEPPGYTLVITFAGPYGIEAVAKCGDQTVDLGEVMVTSP